MSKLNEKSARRNFLFSRYFDFLNHIAEVSKADIVIFLKYEAEISKVGMEIFVYFVFIDIVFS